MRKTIDYEMILDAKAGDRDCQNDILAYFLPEAKYITNKNYPDLPKDVAQDIVQGVSIALLKGIDTFIV